MTTLTIKLKKLYPLQDEVIRHPARFKVVCVGRRAGKTEMGKDVLINAALEHPAPYGYFAPTHKALSEVWDSLKSTLFVLTERVSEQEKRLELVTGAVIEAWSLVDPDTPRGRSYAGVVIDEAASVKKMEYAWNEVIRPMLTDRIGWAYFLSTPKGRNFFWTLYRRGADEAYPDWQSWQHPTSINPYIDENEIELARHELPELAFRQEYLAEFLDDAGMVFRNVTACIQAAPERVTSVVIGVDWGRSNDYTVLIAMDRQTRRVVEIDRFNQVNWTIQRGRLLEMTRRWPVELVLAESNSIGEPNIEELQKMGLPVNGFQTTQASKQQIIDALALAFEQQSIGIPQYPVLISELQAYEMERLPSGNWRYSAPEGQHDDTVISLALALRAASVSKIQLWI